jgi:hypothetical protein
MSNSIQRAKKLVQASVVAAALLCLGSQVSLAQSVDAQSADALVVPDLFAVKSTDVDSFEQVLYAQQLFEQSLTMSRRALNSTGGRVRLTVPFELAASEVPPALLQATASGAGVAVGASVNLRRYRLSSATIDLATSQFISRESRVEVDVPRAFVGVSRGPVRLLLGDYRVRWAQGLVLSTQRAFSRDSIDGDMGLTRFGGTVQRCASEPGIPKGGTCAETATLTADLRFRPALRGVALSADDVTFALGKWSAAAVMSLRLVDVNPSELSARDGCANGATCSGFRHAVETRSGERLAVAPSVPLNSLAEELLLGTRATTQFAQRVSIGLTGLWAQRRLPSELGSLNLSMPSAFANDGRFAVAGADVLLELEHVRVGTEVAVMLKDVAFERLNRLGMSGLVEWHRESHVWTLLAWFRGSAFTNPFSFTPQAVSDLATAEPGESLGARLGFRFRQSDWGVTRAQLSLSAQRVNAQVTFAQLPALQLLLQSELTMSRYVTPWVSFRASAARQSPDDAVVCVEGADDFAAECVTASLQATIGARTQRALWRWVTLTGDGRYSQRSSEDALSRTFSGRAEAMLYASDTLRFGAAVRYVSLQTPSARTDSVNVSLRGTLHIGRALNIECAYRSGPFTLQGVEQVPIHRVLVSAEWTM